MSVDINSDKRHRPQSLDLGLAKNSDISSSIVLPHPEVKEVSQTLRLSQEIQKQQRQIIALMNLAKTGDDDASSDDSDYGKDLGEREPTPTLAKRLKRDNVPTPLNINLINKSNNQPLVHSAPIRRPVVANPPSGQVAGRRRGPVPMLRRFYRPFPNTQVTYQAYSLGYGYPNNYLVPQWTPYPQAHWPYPSGTPVVNRRHRPTTTPGSSKKVEKVTDVYHGDYTKAAPLLLQPLLAQRDAFDFRNRQQRLDEDRLPVLEDEVREMQEKYEQGRLKPKASDEVFGLINLMNELVFNFRIFRKNQDDGNKEKHEKDGDSQDDTDWLSQEKERFLKICETLWDTFVGSKHQSP